MTWTDLDQRQHDQRQVAAAKDALGPFAAPPSTGAAMAHAVATLVKAARAAAVHGVGVTFVAMLAVMMVVLAAMAMMMMAAVAVFCVV